MGIEDRIRGDLMQLIPWNKKWGMAESQWERDRDPNPIIVHTEAQTGVIVDDSESAGSHVR
jgi:hypothetical protein